MSADKRLNAISEYPTNPQLSDAGRIVGGVFIGAFTVGTASELWNQIVPNHLQKRQIAWHNQVAAAINELREEFRALTPEALGQNERFVSALVQATIIAMKTNEVEKLEALKWATINSALDLDSEGTREFMFMCWIDEFSPLHLRILGVLNDPQRLLTNESIAVSEDGSISYRRMLDRFLPGILMDEALIHQIIRDLRSRNLIDTTLRPCGDGLDTPAYRPVERLPPSELGRRFLLFIEKPRPTSSIVAS